MKNHARVGIVRSVMIGTEAWVFLRLVIAVLGISFQFVDEDVVVGDVPLPLTLVLKLTSFHGLSQEIENIIIPESRSASSSF